VSQSSLPSAESSTESSKSSGAESLFEYSLTTGYPDMDHESRGLRLYALSSVALCAPLFMTHTGTTSTSWIGSRIKKYGAAEALGTIASAIGVATATVVFDSPVWVAIIGTLSENVGFYSVILYNEFRTASKNLAAQGRSPSWKSRLNVIGSTCVTFGVAESVDSLFTRPTLLGLGGYTGELLGHLAGGTGQVAMGVGAFLCKFAADVVYYSMVEIQGAAVRTISDVKRSSR
jgi:hypothetical protein